MPGEKALFCTGIGAMKDTFGCITRTVWELSRLIGRDRENYSLRADYLRYYHESRLFVERRLDVAEEHRSFLLLQQRDSICCLLLHGLGGTPAEMRPLGNFLFDRGYTVYGMRLVLGADFEIAKSNSGRKTFAPIFAAGSPNREGYDWERCLCDARSVLSSLMIFSPDIILFGFSFGATLALELLRDGSSKGAVLIAPGLYPATDPRSAFLLSIRKLTPKVAARLFPREFALLDFVERTRERIEFIDRPILVVQARGDKVVSQRGLRFLKERARNPKSRFELLESPRHVIVTGPDAPRVFEVCGDFLKNL